MYWFVCYYVPNLGQHLAPEKSKDCEAKSEPGLSNVDFIPILFCDFAQITWPSCVFISSSPGGLGLVSWPATHRVALGWTGRKGTCTVRLGRDAGESTTYMHSFKWFQIGTVSPVPFAWTSSLHLHHTHVQPSSTTWGGLVHSIFSKLVKNWGRPGDLSGGQSNISEICFVVLWNSWTTCSWGFGKTVIREEIQWKKSSLSLIIEQFFKVTLCAKGWSKSVRDSKRILILFILSHSVCIKKKFLSWSSEPMDLSFIHWSSWAVKAQVCFQWPGQCERSPQ